MNNAIINSLSTRPFLCAELRDAIVAKTASLSDARRINKVFGEGRDVTTWQHAARSHLPCIAPALTTAQQAMLATHIQTSPKNTYVNCRDLWRTMDVSQLETAALSFADTKDAKALKPTLLLETLERYKDAIDNLPSESRTSADNSIEALLDALAQSLLTEAQKLKRAAQLDTKLTLVLDPGVTALPAILSAFDHVTQLELRSVGESVDLSVLEKMANLHTVTVQYASGVAQEALAFKDIAVQVGAIEFAA